MKYRDALAVALREYMEGGRLAFLVDRAERLAQSEASTPQDKVGEISDQLGEAFRLPEFLSAAEAVGVTTEKYAIKKFLPDVLNRTETVPHPGNSRVFIPRTADGAPENPNPANLPYHAMTDEDKRVGVQVAAIREAWRNGGKGRVTVREGVDTLAGNGSPRHKTVRAVMREAAADDGFRYDESEEPVLKVDTDALNTTTTAWAIAAEQNEETTTGTEDTEDTADARREAEQEADMTFAQHEAADIGGGGR